MDRHNLSLGSMPRKILYIVNNPDFFLSHRLPIALAARAAGYQVSIATPHGEGIRRITEAGFDFYEVPMSRSGRHPFRELQDRKSVV